MELNLFSLILAFALLATLLFCSLLYKQSQARFNGRNTPPGTTEWPIIGESLEFLAAGWKGQSDRFVLDRVAKYSSNVFKTSLFLKPTVVLVGAEANRFLFTENKLVRPWWPNEAKKVFPTVPDGSELRRDSIEENDESLAGKGPRLGEYTMALACKLFLDMEDPRQVEKIAAPISVLLCAIFSIPINVPGTWFSKGVKAAAILRQELLAVSKQLMRLTPPQQGAFREAIQDFEYQGFFIPKGCEVCVICYLGVRMHMNPKYHPEPEKFDPSRFRGNGMAPHTYVPFGGGVRMCPGKEYSCLELLVFMHNLVTRFRFKKVIADEKIVLNPMPSPAKGLPIRLFRHES
uniref:Cytochrome P450 n=1 Tax=Kalanchoe fedtschenkoi TaxID=63787 RepID=A0A7N0TA95_KALFE